MTVLVVNPNTNTATTAAMVRIAAAAGTGLAFAGRTAAFGAPMIVDAAALAVGAEAVAALASEIRRETPPPAGVIVAAFGDPGIAAARAELSCPVCGIGEASFLEAAAGGRRFAVATTTPGLVASIAARVEGLCLSAGFGGTVLTEGDPLALMADPALLLERLHGAVEAAARAGAEAVIIGGGPLAEAARELRPLVAVPLIEPVPAAARLMAALIAGHSPHGPNPHAA